MNPQGNEYFSLMRAANYLGLRYDHAKHAVDTSDRLLEDISAKFGKCVWAPGSNTSHTQRHCSSTTERSNEKLESNLKLPFNATYQGIKLGAEYSSQTTGKVVSLKGSIVYTVFRIDSRECTYKKIPPLNAFIPDATIDRGTYVKSVWMNTWYKVNFIIKFDKRDKTDETNYGYGLNAGYVEIAKGELKKSNLEEKLKNKKIKHITVEIEGLSDFQLTVPDGPLNTIEDINEKCDLIEQDYLDKLNTVSARAFFVDPSNCLGITPVLPLPKVLPTFKPKKVVTKSVTPHEPDFIKLSKDIFSTMTPAYKDAFEAILGGISLFEMLASMENVFKTAFQHPPLMPKTSSIVFGVTGDGKSTFIGYKNEAQLTLKKDDNLNFAYHYPDDNKLYPPMGRADESSKTKGYAVYGNTIDTAGFFDRKGKGEELCNKMALDFAIESCQPGHIMIVLNPSKISDSRGTAFFQLMEKLNQFVRNPSRPDIFASTLFVFNEIIRNPNNELLTEENIKQDIDNKIKQLEKEIQADIRQFTGWGDHLKNLAVSASNTVGLGKMMATQLFGNEWAKNKANEIKDIDEALAAKISENLQIQDLLQQLKDSKNIIVADFREDKTRLEIEKWEKDTPKLPDDAFKISQSLDNTRLPFFESLKVIASYFNDQCKKAKGLENDIRVLKGKIQNTKNIIAQIPDGNVPTDDDMDNYKKLKKQEEDEKTTQEGLRATAKANIKLLSDKQTRLSQSTDKKLLLNLGPKTPITPRSRWAYFDFTAKKYFFEYKEPNLADINYIKPTENEKYPGVFINPQKIQKKDKEKKTTNQNTFQATYRPGYHSLAEDQNAIVELYVEKKDHPDTIAKVNTIVMVAIPKENDDLNEANREIIRLKGAIANWDMNIQNGTDALRQKQLKDDYEKNLDDYRAERKDVKEELTKINSELATYHSYCQLLREILVNFQLQRMLPSKDNALADEFIVNFK